MSTLTARTKNLALPLLFSSALAGASGVASAAPAPTSLAQPAAAALTPPRLVKFVDALYPEAARAAGRGAAVELELALDAAGKVSEASVVTPVGDGFDEAALAAARAFDFEPARRGSEAIPARIRYRYVFEPPAPPPTTGALGGRVLLKAGDDLVRGAEVTLSSDDGSITRAAATAADGTFAFADLPPGRYRLRVGGADLQAVDVQEEITAGDMTEVTYRLTPAAVKASGGELEFGATATVEAPPREVTKRTLKAEELLRVAGTRGDPLKAIEYMPGVARGGQGLMIIRGSSPGDSQFQFEGAPIYRLYHFGDLTSFVNGRLLDRIDLYPGNFSARYGRKIGGIVDVGVRDPQSDRFHGMVDVNVIDTSLLVEAPLSKRLSVAIAAKRSQLDLFLDKLMPEEIGMTAAPVYYDYQLLASYRPTERDQVRAMIYGSYDNLKLVLKKPVDDKDPSIRGDFGQRSDFHRAQLLWKRRWSDAVEHEITITSGPTSFKATLGPEVGWDVTGTDLFARAELRAQVLRRVRLITGLDLSQNWLNGVYTGPAVEPLDGNPAAFDSLASKHKVEFNRSFALTDPAAYAELIIQATDRLTLVPGIRGDYYSEIDRFTVDPRINGRYELGYGTTMKGGVGIYSQAPDFGEALPVLGNPKLGTARSQHYGLGFDQKVGQRLLLTVDGFYKRLDKLVVGSPVPGENLMNGGIGRIWGGEASARLAPSKRTTGFVSYTLSRSRRNDRNEGWRAFNWDQTHILTVAGSLRLGHGWDLSSTFRYVTGNPNTPTVGSTYNANNDLYRPQYGAVNSTRNNAFHRLDLRVEKSWQVGSGSVATYLDLQNAYNNRPEEGRTYNYDFSRSKAIPGLPVIPSLGIRGEI
jgi:TonB family protein